VNHIIDSAVRPARTVQIPAQPTFQLYDIQEGDVEFQLDDIL